MRLVLVLLGLFLTINIFSLKSFGSEISDSILCLAKNIYYESRDQDLDGQLLVIDVVLNRVKSSFYPNSICDVIYQKTYSKKSNKDVCQFSWYCDGKSDNPAMSSVWLNILSLARREVFEYYIGQRVFFDDSLTHYHADYVTPYWSEKLKLVLVVGNHLFYK